MTKRTGHQPNYTAAQPLSNQIMGAAQINKHL